MNLRIVVAGLLAVAPIFADAPENDAGNVRVHGGYSLKALARALDYPAAIAVSDAFPMVAWVAEGRFLPCVAPNVKRIDANGTVTTILSGTQLPGRFEGPLTDVTFNNGWLWITHRQLGANGPRSSDRGLIDSSPRSLATVTPRSR